jgi:hypothetical protein
LTCFVAAISSQGRDVRRRRKAGGALREAMGRRSAELGIDDVGNE